MYTCRSEKKNAKAVIVIVHGAGEHYGRYRWLVEQWNGNGYHVIIGDLPGQGKTNGKRGHIDSFDEYINTVEQWLNEAFTFQLPVLLFGHSMGGLIVIRTMMEKTLPVNAVILSSPCLGLVHNPPIVLEQLSKLLNKIKPTMLVPSNVRPGTGTRNEEIKLRDRDDSLYVRKVSIRWYRELRKAMDIAHRQTERYPDKPLLVMQAGDDRIVNKIDVKSWFQHLPISHKTYKEWEGLYHEVLNEPERDDVFRYALQFADKHTV